MGRYSAQKRRFHQRSYQASQNTLRLERWRREMGSRRTAAMPQRMRRRIADRIKSGSLTGHLKKHDHHSEHHHPKEWINGRILIPVVRLITQHTHLTYPWESGAAQRNPAQESHSTR